MAIITIITILKRLTLTKHRLSHRKLSQASCVTPVMLLLSNTEKPAFRTFSPSSVVEATKILEPNLCRLVWGTGRNLCTHHS
jgi:hypothetical protein